MKSTYQESLNPRVYVFTPSCIACQKYGNQIGILSVETGLLTQIRGPISPRGFVVQERQRYQSSSKFFELFKKFHKKGLAPPQRTQNPQMGNQNFEKIENFQNFRIFVTFKKKLRCAFWVPPTHSGHILDHFSKNCGLKENFDKIFFSGFWTFFTLFKGENTLKMTIFA